MKKKILDWLKGVWAYIVAFVVEDYKNRKG